MHLIAQEKKMETIAKVKLNLVGLDGNAFSLMGAYKSAARRQGIPKEQVDAVLKDCMSGNYDHLLGVLVANTESDDGSDEDDGY